MKLFTTIIAAIIGVLLTLAALSTPDPSYGKWPFVMLATTASSLLVTIYFAAYGWLRRDKYIMGAMLYILVDAGFKLALLPNSTNAFGRSWAFMIALSGPGLPLLIFGVIRILYIGITTRTNPLKLSANKE